MKKLFYLLNGLLLTAALAACSSHDLYEDPEQPKSHQMEGQGENDTTDYSKETIPPVEANAEVREFFENALKMVDGENDFFYDEIGSVLKIKQYRNERRELLESIETYYRIVFLGEGLEEE